MFKETFLYIHMHSKALENSLKAEVKIAGNEHNYMGSKTCRAANL